LGGGKKSGARLPLKGKIYWEVNCKMKSMLLGFVCFTLLGGQSLAQEEVNSYKELLSGEKYPLTLKLKDLDRDWRRLTLSGVSEMGSYLQMVNMMMGALTNFAYYTKGETVTIRNEVFLITYRPHQKQLGWQELMRSGPTSQPPTPEPLTPETTLALSLINARTIGSINEIVPFDLEQEIQLSKERMLTETEDHPEEPVSFGRSDPSLMNLRQLATAVLMYAQDYDDVLPPMKTEAQAREALLPYIRNESVFVHPVTKKPYKPNPVLSGKKIKHIANPAGMVLFYESDPVDELRGAAFLDGHAARLNSEEWDRRRKASKIP